MTSRNNDKGDATAVTISTPLYYDDEGDTSERWQKSISDVRQDYAEALGIEDNGRLRNILHQCVWCLSFYDESTISNIIDVLYDGDFFDDILDRIPDGKRKDVVIDTITAASDAEARRLRKAVEQLG